MKTILEILSELVSASFEQCGYNKAFGTVSLSDRLDLCQFQCNGSFDAAKQYRKSPFEIAGQVVEVLRFNDIFKSVEAIRPGFINMTVQDNVLLELVVQIAQDENLGIPQVKEKETIVLDYGGPNVAKPLHIGHLRAAIIGESLKRIAKATGRKVLSDVHLGDWGLQIGLVIAELEERYPDWKCFDVTFNEKCTFVSSIDVDALNEIYPLASKKSKEDEAFKEKARHITYELQHGHAGYIALWKEIMRVSVADLRKSYDKLNVNFDFWYGESDAETYVEPLIETLTKQGLLYESEGALVVDVMEESDKATVPPIIIKKSDNSNIYATTDLATIMQRQADFKPNQIWYVVDKRQSMHFTQVFRCAKKANLVPESTQLEHLGFGTMNGSDGKPYKTRDGGVMRLSDLLDTVIRAAYQKLNKTETRTEEEQQDIAQKIGIAAIKFGDLSNHRSKDYVFDIDKFLSFEGKTGTYLLYTITRINSILKKVNGQKEQTIASDSSDIVLHDVYTEIERQLLLNIVLSSQAFQYAVEEKAPNYICDNAYKLATTFSSFYHENHIADEVDEKKKETWISLCKLTRNMLLKHLDVLGIDAVDSM